ncbi:restriction endonuclease subunit S [Kribbella sp. NPDC003505]|uniref:restriction endonuclease subunit S n=1 Tax=Kribbella sp. NPDC003505 TaxID=3154448 RepID=UPI0033BA2583
MTQVLGAELPTEWRAARLKDCISFLNRGTAPDYVDDGPVRAISQAANQSGGLDWSRTRFHSHSGDPAKLRGYLLAGDILVNSTGTGTLGRIGYFQRSPDNRACMADGHVTITRTRRDVLWPRFGYYWLASTPFQDLIFAALSLGATNQIELSRERFSEAPVPLPPIEEQRRIADFLDSEVARIDALVARSERQIVALAEHLQEVMRVATTCDSPTDVKATGIAWMPYVSADWSLHRISRIFAVGSGTTPPSERLEYYRNGDQYWVTSTDVRDAVISDTRSKVTHRATVEIPSLVVHPAGSLVIAMYGAGATKGRVGLLEMAAAVNQACCVLSNPGEVLPRFAFYWFRAHKAGIIQLASGAGQPNLSAELIKSLVIPAPPPRRQESIVRRLELEQSATERATSLLRERVTLLRERRQALIAAAVTGQIDVTTARGGGFS